MLFIPLFSVFAGLSVADSDCYPIVANSTGDTLTIIKTTTTPNGFSSAAKGWNSWGMQASPDTTPSYPSSLYPYVNQTFVIEQCTVLADADILAAGWTLCSIDDGWYSDITDDYGRMVYNTTLFDMPTLADYLHDLSLDLGLYNRPGIPCEAANKTIYGTDVTVGSTFSGVEDDNGYCYFDYDNANTQVYHNTLIDLWAYWGVDMIKLDYITPGSSTGDAGYPSNSSASAIAYHQAIANSGRSIRLDLSSNVCRDEPNLGIWEANVESIRLPVDINSYGASVFVGMWRIQQIIEQYRQNINYQVDAGKRMSLHPDLDDLFVANPASVSGVTDGQRMTLMSFWLGASSNFLLGSDMTNIDDLGMQLLTSSAGSHAAEFCNGHPLQPRNPDTGSNQALQLQAWLSGPSGSGKAYVLLTNLGENLGHGGYTTVTTGNGTVSVTLDDLGLMGSSYTVEWVWYGNKPTLASGGT
ncbi:hypothetical protein N7493_000262 [Penicillium malachiteum]|uniref:alpha-galactosidase n=1 Tax=Penicillium malachiteum TaxID=1324776 RepID=A0AAD6HW58_9EURO|nr:hypothetical protein N7493_000262 [Penicillium malachiteum]